MKKLYFVLSATIVVLVLPFFSCNENKKESSDSKDHSTTSTGKNVIHAVTENAYPPLNFLDDKGQGIGLEYELTNKIGEMLGQSIEWHLSSWDIMLQGVRNNLYDVGMDGISITEERLKEIDFSIPYLKTAHVMLVRTKEDRFTNSKEFIENSILKIGSQAGISPFYKGCEMLNYSPENVGPRMILFENFGPSIQALLVGDVDMIISDSLSAKGYIRTTEGKLRILDEIMPIKKSAGMGFAFPKGSPLVKSFNESIETLKTNGFLDKLIEKWYSEDSSWS